LTADRMGHLAYVALIGGQALVAQGDYAALGFALRLCGGLAWVGVGVAMRASSIWFWSGVFVGIDAIGVFRHF
jgi:hypothetical protein